MENRNNLEHSNPKSKNREPKGACLDFVLSTSNAFNHSPTADRLLFNRLEDQPFESESNDTDDRKARHHDIGVEKLLGVEDHPTQSPIRGGDHLTADDSDPRPSKRLSETRDHERERSRQDNFSKQCFLTRAHRLR